MEAGIEEWNRERSSILARAIASGLEPEDFDRASYTAPGGHVRVAALRLRRPSPRGVHRSSRTMWPGLHTGPADHEAAGGRQRPYLPCLRPAHHGDRPGHPVHRAATRSARA